MLPRVPLVFVRLTGVGLKPFILDLEEPPALVGEALNGEPSLPQGLDHRHCCEVRIISLFEVWKRFFAVGRLLFLSRRRLSASVALVVATTRGLAAIHGFSVGSAFLVSRSDWGVWWGCCSVADVLHILVCNLGLRLIRHNTEKNESWDFVN